MLKGAEKAKGTDVGLSKRDSADAQTSPRRDLLTFNHHKVLAALKLKPDLINAPPDWCEEPLKNGSKKGRSGRQLEQFRNFLFVCNGWQFSPGPNEG